MWESQVGTLMNFCSTTEVGFSVFTQNGLAYFSFWKQRDWYWGGLKKKTDFTSLYSLQILQSSHIFFGIQICIEVEVVKIVKHW